MKLLIVIVNYRSADLTIDCLRSLAPELPSVPGTQVVITDNLSPDDSVTKISAAIEKENWSSWARFMPLKSNGGFAYGNNEGIRPYLGGTDRPQYVLLLNPDTIVRPAALSELVKFLDENPKAGIVGSRLEDPDGTPQRSAFRFPTIRSEFENGIRLGVVSKMFENRIVAPPVRNDTHPTDWVAGASMLVRREVFEKVGLMDEQYFMYFEEVDFCLQARRAGFQCWYHPASRVVHLVGQSSGVTNDKQPKKRRPAYWFESRKRYFRKNHGMLVSLLASMAWASGFGLFRLRQILTGKPSNDPPALWWDFIRHNFFFATQ